MFTVGNFALSSLSPKSLLTYFYANFILTSLIHFKHPYLSLNREGHNNFPSESDQ